jgi:hypothetical protein
MNPAHLQFDVEVLDDQRQLNGTRHVSVAGTSASTPAGEPLGWSLDLNFVQSKDGSIEEADLTLSGADGRIFAGLVSGGTDIVTDDIGGDERELLNLILQVDGGDGAHAGDAGEVRLAGDLRGISGQFDIALAPSGQSGRSTDA